jgi:oligosaccharide repeat unit polymerase
MALALATASVAAAVAGTAVYAGRRDLTHPAVSFAAIWFGFAALAQLRLTGFENRWSTTLTLLVLGGGAVFALAAVFAAGAEPVRGNIAIDRARYLPKRLLLVAAVLIAGGIAGWIWKSAILNGLPLFSGQLDVVRARAYGESGQVAVPAWASFLTAGLQLGFWCIVAVLWLERPASRGRRLGLGGVALVALAGTFTGGSRNELLFALVVPLAAAYLMTPRLPRRLILAAAGAAVLAFAIASAVFVLRENERTGGRGFVEREMSNQPPPLRPLLPIYIAGVYPFETEDRLIEAFPDRYAYGKGANSLRSLPDRLFPAGKPDYHGALGDLTWSKPGGPYWTVATYQGRAYADFGAAGVLLTSALLGLLLGSLYRLCRGGTRFLALAATAYAAYYSGFMVYDNLLSFTPIAVYDLAVISAVESWARIAPAVHGVPAAGTLSPHPAGSPTARG